MQSREDEVQMDNRMDIDEEDGVNIEDDEIPEKETNLTEEKQTIELQDSTGDHNLDESHKKSIISMFSNVFYMNTVCVEILMVFFIWWFWVQTIKLKFTN